MGKSDDSILRRKNKANRKKQNESSRVSDRVAAIIAAKKRRKSGKRSMCQGMCYSLPTPEDPFNERHGNADFKTKEINKLGPSKTDRRTSTNRKTPDRIHANIDNQEQKMARVRKSENEQTISLTSVGSVGQKNTIKLKKAQIQLIGKTGATHAQQGHTFEDQGCPSKFLILCLNSIQNALRHDGALNADEDKPFFVDTWGVEFWKCYSIGKAILESSGACSTTEQIAWIASTAADTIARKEKEGLSFTSPFLLFLVPSQEKARKVRSVCKPLKALGIHTVSLHPGAPLDHQIHGLRNCEPEFLVSTPERLLELVSSKAVDISAVSSLVVDGVESFSKGGCLAMIISIRQYISGNPHTVVFNDCLSYASIPVVQNLLPGSVCRFSLNASITSLSACILQSIHVCASEEEKLTMGLRVLDQECGNQLDPQPSKVLFIVGKDSNSHELVTAAKSKCYSISANSTNSEIENSKTGPSVFVMDVERIRTANLSEFKVVLISKFVISVDNYIQILTRMARYTVNGKLHSFLTRADASVAAPLIEILEQCGQAVPEALRHLCHASSSMLEH